MTPDGRGGLPTERMDSFRPHLAKVAGGLALDRAEARAAFDDLLSGEVTPVQAGAAQLLVLIGLLSTQTITIVVASRLVRTGFLLPRDLRQDLPA